LIGIIAVWALGGALTAHRLRANPGTGLVFFYLRAVIFEWLVVAYLAWGVGRHGGRLRGLIGGSWERAKDFWRDVLVAFVFWIASLACLAALRVALRMKRNLAALRFLAPHTRAEVIVWILVSITAGICEEIIFRGYLQRQFIAWSGKRAVGILLSAVLFGLAHAYQGGKQTILLGAFGALFGILAERRRSLRPGMMAHAWQDALSGLAIRLIPK
jgi:membrane protease YdiL (CAAX protease family)